MHAHTHKKNPKKQKTNKHIPLYKELQEMRNIFFNVLCLGQNK